MNDDSSQKFRTEDPRRHEWEEPREATLDAEESDTDGIEGRNPVEHGAGFEHKGYYIQPTSSRGQASTTSRGQASNSNADPTTAQDAERHFDERYAERRYEDAVRRPWFSSPGAWWFLGLCALGLFAYLGFANLSTQQQENRIAQDHLRMIEESQVQMTQEAERQRIAQERNETFLDQQREELAGIREQLADIQATLQEWFAFVREQFMLWQARSANP